MAITVEGKKERDLWRAKEKRLQLFGKGREINKIGKSRYGEAKEFEFEFHGIKMN